VLVRHDHRLAQRATGAIPHAPVPRGISRGGGRE
jgi:hypothetical protein